MPARQSIAQTRRHWKVKVVQKRAMVQEMMEQIRQGDMDSSIAFIQELIPCGLQALEERLIQETEMLAGERYQHGKENLRWGFQGGSVYLRDQKVPITVQRLRNKATDTEIPLPTYQKLQSPYLADRQTTLKLLNGISTRKYKQCAELVPEVFGISPSNLSRRFKLQTTKALERLNIRRLDNLDIVCIFIDGKRYAEDGLMIALGITLDGRKVILGIEQSHSENASALGQFLDRLMERGLSRGEGILFIVDGSKGIIRAIKEKFGCYGFIQRCVWHKEQNVTSYLSEQQRRFCKKQLQEAYAKKSYQQAKAALGRLHHHLLTVNQSAAQSLSEGLEETLTLHRLGLREELGRSLSSTNCIESVMAQLGQFTDKVDYWRNSSQILRWTATGLLEIEPALRRIWKYKQLGLLRLKLKKEIRKLQGKQETLEESPELVTAGAV